MNYHANKPRKTLLQRWKNIRFQHRLTIGITALHFILMSTIVFDLVNRQHDFLHRQGHHHAGSLAKTLAVTSASWVMANDLVGLQEVTSSVASNPHVKYVMVLSPNLRVLSHNQQEFLGMYASDDASLKMLDIDIQDGNITSVVIAYSHSLDDLAAPIIMGNKLIGWARVGIDQSYILDNLMQALIHAVFYLIIGSFIAYLFARLVAKWLVTGLSKLAEGFNQFRSGERGLRINIESEDEIGQLANGFNLMLDELEAKESSLQDLATTDFLTGLKNRRSFMQGLQAELAKVQHNNNYHATLLLLDLDHFKRINDNHGHLAGDAVLRHIANIMRANMRPGDLTGRYGGEEFIILLLDCNLEGALKYAERLRQQIATNPLEWEQEQLVITTSIGVTMLNKFDKSPEAAVNRADTALYRAKENGRNLVETELPCV